MEVIKYEQEKAKFNNSEIVEGIFRNFNQKEDKISDFKLIFILQNGEYLLMPYLDIDINTLFHILDIDVEPQR